MDEELKRYLDSMMARINDGQEAILNRLTSLERDFQNAQEFFGGRCPRRLASLARP